MRESLGRLSRSLLAEGSTLAEHVSMAQLLPLLGLERRRSTLSTVAPALGALLVGTVVGSLAANPIRRWIENAIRDSSSHRRVHTNAYSSNASVHGEVAT
jgi:hypothetical protein